MYRPYTVTARELQGTDFERELALEKAVIDSLRQMGCRLRQYDGGTYLIVEIFDEQTGELTHRVRALDTERFSEVLARNW